MTKRMIASLILFAGAPAVAQMAPSADVAPSLRRAPTGAPAGSPEAVGDLIAGPFDMENMVSPANNGMLGVTYLKTSGGKEMVYVSSRGEGAVAPHLIYAFEYDSCAQTMSFLQKFQTSFTGSWGGRDGSSGNDEIFFGAEAGQFKKYTVDPNTGMITAETDMQTQVADTIRSLLQLPNGNFVTFNFGNPGWEFDSNGFPVAQIPSVLSAVFGGAYDPVNGTVWLHSQSDPNSGNCSGMYVAEYTYANCVLTPTGRSYRSDVIAGTGTCAAGAIAGGMDIFTDAAGNLVHILLGQGTPDSVVVHCGEDVCDPCASCYPDCDGNGTLDLFDFLCFTNAFNGGDPYADCDGNATLDLFDFLCFTNAFNAGCP